MSGRALVLLSLALVVPFSLASISPARAQSSSSPIGPNSPAAAVPAAAPPPPPPGRAPERCGMTDATVDYGELDIGSVVTLQRHRMVRGDDNWDPLMERYLGRSGHITRLSGVDERGCAGVQVDTDGSRYFWRIRDLGIGTNMQPLPAAIEGSEVFPQNCHQRVANYGGATIGATVVLGRHRAVDGDTNWAEDMAPFVGRTAHVASFGDLDTEGCPGVRVDIDNQQWFWRVRDLRPAGDTSVYETFSAVDDTALAPSLGVTTDHGRPASTGIFGSGGVPGPQGCGLTDAQVVWDPIALGAQVILGRHRAVGVMPDGVTPDENWDVGMDPFVGMAAHVTQLAGVDDQGCPSVRVDVDGGNYVWRVRDMSVTGGGTMRAVPGWSGIRTWPNDCGLVNASYGPVVVGSRIVLGVHTPWSGTDQSGQPVVQDSDWNDEMMPFVGSTATVTQLDGVDAPAGCSGVRVDIDGGQWFWRLRDAHPAP